MRPLGSRTTLAPRLPPGAVFSTISGLAPPPSGQRIALTYLGIDVGTSAVKAVLVDEHQALLGQASAELPTMRPHDLWSEQDPETWWSAVERVVGQLRQDLPTAFAATRSVGLSGQMHGAVMLGDDDRALRPAILWNDGRSFREAEELARQPGLSEAAGVLPMSGFTAPKLLWVARHEPSIFRTLRTVLLPKDYIRLKLTGERVTDMSDAAGTWWLDEAARDWSDAALAATGLARPHMPGLIEGSAASGHVRRDVLERWGLSGPVIVAGGAGDAAAGGIGLGAIREGAAFVSLGTSGQLFVATNSFKPAPQTSIHAFCHALPGRWYQMAAMLNGASCLAWAAGLLGSGIDPLLREAEAGFAGPSEILFLPYLTGERTPHNDPHARGVFFGLSAGTRRADLVVSVLEGVAFSFADAAACLHEAGTPLTRAGVVGGGARSRLWTHILAAGLGLPLVRYEGGEQGPAFGAARLARLAVTGEDPEAVCTPPRIIEVVEPDPALTDAYRPRVDAFRRLYRALAPEFRHDRTTSNDGPDSPAIARLSGESASP
jgi:xylulokinase